MIIKPCGLPAKARPPEGVKIREFGKFGKRKIEPTVFVAPEITVAKAPQLNNGLSVGVVALASRDQGGWGGGRGRQVHMNADDVLRIDGQAREDSGVASGRGARRNHSRTAGCRQQKRWPSFCFEFQPARKRRPCCCCST